MAKDDSREVDWAPKKIKAWEQELALTDEAVVALNERVSRLEKQTEFETSEDDAHLRNLSKRMTLMENQWSQTVTDLKEENRGLRAAVYELQHTVGLSRGVVPGLKTIPVDPPIKIESGDTVMLGGLFEDPDYSPPVGGTGTDQLLRKAQAENFDQSTKNDVYERGFIKGKKSALNGAEQRIRDYMESRNLGKLTTDGVIRAMIGNG